MKKWMIIGLTIVVLLLLLVRGLYVHWNNAKNERPEYVKDLHFHFSATVDSLRVFSRTNGLVYFHTTGGDLNRSTEHRINQHLKYNRELQFIFNPFGKDKLGFHARDLNNYNTGDSLVINSDEDKIYIYRKEKLVAQSLISKALSGRPF
jgi:hypothetical protein